MEIRRQHSPSDILQSAPVQTAHVQLLRMGQLWRGRLSPGRRKTPSLGHLVSLPNRRPMTETGLWSTALRFARDAAGALVEIHHGRARSDALGLVPGAKGLHDQHRVEGRLGYQRSGHPHVVAVLHMRDHRPAPMSRRTSLCRMRVRTAGGDL